MDTGSLVDGSIVPWFGRTKYLGRSGGRKWAKGKERQSVETASCTTRGDLGLRKSVITASEKLRRLRNKPRRRVISRIPSIVFTPPCNNLPYGYFRADLLEAQRRLTPIGAASDQVRGGVSLLPLGLGGLDLERDSLRSGVGEV